MSELNCWSFEDSQAVLMGCGEHCTLYFTILVNCSSHVSELLQGSSAVCFWKSNECNNKKVLFLKMAVFFLFAHSYIVCFAFSSFAFLVS